MNVSALWKYVSTGLFAILSVFIVSAIASIIFLSYTLAKLDSIITDTGEKVGTALVLQDLLINLDEAESAARGYLIGVSQNSKDLYYRATSQIPANLKAIENNEHLNISDSQVKDLRDLTDARLLILDKIIAIRSQNDEQTTRDLIALNRGAVIMEKIRTQVKTISNASQRTIEPSQQASHDALRRALFVAVILVLVILGICITLSWYFQRALLRERALENTKNEFLSLASHQLRTPATNVKQYIGLMLDGYLGDITEKQRNALEVAYKNNESEIRIMNDLLDVAKLDLKRIHLHMQSANIVTIVRQVLNEYKERAKERDIELVFRAPKELMAKVDRSYFKGVVENLVDNALKYSQPNTTVLVKVKAKQVEKMFEVTVIDQGLGIKKRDAAKLFMKFSRLANEFSANSEGSGLGLYWVKEVMALLGGTVEVVSKEAEGSKFTIRAPLT